MPHFIYLSPVALINWFSCYNISCLETTKIKFKCSYELCFINYHYIIVISIIIILLCAWKKLLVCLCTNLSAMFLVFLYFLFHFDITFVLFFFFFGFFWYKTIFYIKIIIEFLRFLLSIFMAARHSNQSHASYTYIYVCTHTHTHWYMYICIQIIAYIYVYYIVLILHMYKSNLKYEMC